MEETGAEGGGGEAAPGAGGQGRSNEWRRRRLGRAAGGGNSCAERWGRGPEQREKRGCRRCLVRQEQGQATGGVSLVAALKDRLWGWGTGRKGLATVWWRRGSAQEA